MSSANISNSKAYGIDPWFEDKRHSLSSQHHSRFCADVSWEIATRNDDVIKDTWPKSGK